MNYPAASRYDSFLNCEASNLSFRPSSVLSIDGLPTDVRNLSVSKKIPDQSPVGRRNDNRTRNELFNTEIIEEFF